MMQSLSVLIMDDSLVVCSVLEQFLNDFGVHDITVVHGGDNGLEAIANREQSFDAVFIDLHMQGTSALTVMRGLHADHYAGCVILMSALAAKVSAAIAQIVNETPLAIAGSLSKPFDRSAVAFMTRRIKNAQPKKAASQYQLTRDEVVEAIDNQQVLIYFQPKISSIDNGVLSLECLARLDLGRKGVLPPGVFIPLVEKYGLTAELSKAVFSVAFQHFSEFVAAQNVCCGISLNIFRTQLKNDLLAESLSAYAEKYGLRHDDITLEIKENENLYQETFRHNIHNLADCGFTLALDDYRGARMSYQQCSKMPFSEIKVDSYLVDGLFRDHASQTIVESIRQYSKANNQRLVVEGVTDSKDLLVLNDIGVDAYQGYLFCRPKPLRELQRWMKVWRGRIIESEITDIPKQKASYFP